MSIPFMLTPSGVKILCNGKPFVVNQEHINYEAILKALKEKEDENTLMGLLDLSRKVLSKKFGKEDSYFFFNDNDDSRVFAKFPFSDRPFELPRSLAKKVSSIIKKDLPYENILSFTKKLYLSGSSRVVCKLFDYLEKYEIPILDNGNFYSYIKVAYDYYDFPGTHLCKVGSKVRIERFEVDDDHSNDRGYGLSVCPIERIDDYFIIEEDNEEVNPFERVMVVSVDPSDVISIPLNEESSLLRVCGFKVVNEIAGNFSKEILSWSYGTHSEEWALKIFERVVNFFKLFYANKRIVKFDWLPDDVITDREISATLVEDFMKKVKEEFVELKPTGPLTQESIDKALAGAVDSPQSLVEILSQVIPE